MRKEFIADCTLLSRTKKCHVALFMDVYNVLIVLIIEIKLLEIRICDNFWAIIYLFIFATDTTT